jgi:hypothetical protein
VAKTKSGSRENWSECVVAENCHLVSVPGRQVQRVEAVHVRDVDSAAKGAQGLRQAEEALPRRDVDRGVAGGVGLQ